MKDQQIINRRNFLTMTALAGAGLMAAPLHSFGSVSSSEKTNKSKMKTRKLGTLEVSEIGLGCMNMTGNYNPPADHQQSIATIRKPLKVA